MDVGTSAEAKGGDSKVSTIVMEVDIGNRSYLIYIGSSLLYEPNLLQTYSSRLKIQSSMLGINPFLPKFQMSDLRMTPASGDGHGRAPIGKGN